jgi:hypothetical protein
MLNAGELQIPEQKCLAKNNSQPEACVPIKEKKTQ